jgi:hypothetical protein
MYRPIPETPSDRDRNIYYDCLAGMTQRRAAEKYEITQARVCQIVKQFKLWRVAYAAEEEFSGAEQDFLANDALLELCERGKEMALQGWEMSLKPQQQETEEGRGRWIPAKPDMRCIKQMIECGQKAVEATKNMESARYLLRCERDRDPTYQAEQARLRREECERRVEAQKRRDREAAERRAAEEAAAAALIKTAANPENPREKAPASDLSSSTATSPVAAAAFVVNASAAASAASDNRLSNPPRRAEKPAENPRSQALINRAGVRRHRSHHRRATARARTRPSGADTTNAAAIGVSGLRH